MLPRSARLLTPAIGAFQSARAPISRSFTSTHVPMNSSQQSSAYKDGMKQYKTFTGPFAKVFLGGVFVYQVIYWTWLKLEMDETKVRKNEQVAVLEKQAREIADSQK
ncbi:uncharacterized protein N7511_006509 [Penicillium nucicola]|uniref:uncharacterized protein n=1 Tax=Penicillium nucicola TaxID=1850975 RepID=UPI00254591E7|nr:uncharacterized protein N7511_006509 [Penicillium nucicola]KAJ5757815.1 hypothetical protein N7511_006509 [Penicillium nucicola]